MGGGPVGASLGGGRAKTAGQAQERLVAPAEEEAGLKARTLTPTLALTLALTLTRTLALSLTLTLTLTPTRTLNLALTRRATRHGRRSSPPAETVRRRARRGRRARRSGSRRSWPTDCIAAAPRSAPSPHSLGGARPRAPSSPVKIS